jgi:hypothetical protein
MNPIASKIISQLARSLIPIERLEPIAPQIGTGDGREQGRFVNKDR